MMIVDRCGGVVIRIPPLLEERGTIIFLEVKNMKEGAATMP